MNNYEIQRLGLEGSDVDIDHSLLPCLECQTIQKIETLKFETATCILLEEKTMRDFFQYRSRYPSPMRGREWTIISFAFDEATAIISVTRMLDQ